MLDDDPPYGLGWDDGWAVWCKAHAAKPFGAPSSGLRPVLVQACFAQHDNTTNLLSFFLPSLSAPPQVSTPRRGTAWC